MLHANEKAGGNRIKNSRINAFASCLSDCDLSDLGYIGNKFTWSNRRFTSIFISEILDRDCGNNLWINKFPNTIVRNLPNTTSNHKPILNDNKADQRRNNRILIYENIWNQNKIFRENLEVFMRQNTLSNNNLSNKLNLLTQNIKNWPLRDLHDIDKQIQNLTSMHEELKDMFILTLDFMALKK